MTLEDRRITSQSFLWENEPMSAAAVLGGHHTDPMSKSKRSTSSNVSFNADAVIDASAASCVWENEPMSAAASLSYKVGPRLSLDRVSEVSELLIDSGEGDVYRGLAGPPRLTVQTSRHSVTSTQSGVPAWRPHRPAPPPPPQRAASFPNHKQNEDYLEYEVTSALTLKETPRSQRRHDLQRKIWESQDTDAESTALVSAVAQHHRTPDDQPHVSFALPSSASQGSPLLLVSLGNDAAMTVAPAVIPLERLAASAESADESPESTPLPASELAEQETGQAAVAVVKEPADVPEASDATQGLHAFHSSSEEAHLMSRKSSVMTLCESAHSGALSESAGTTAVPLVESDDEASLLGV